ncbi:MAG TPA: HU family DNA-binding protein [Pyrinomonadaceae bacterium]|nr:HU family DNA-binding protein [Pyrinomonadaceae bacterium]
MEELIKQVSERSGISEAQARKAVDTVMNYMRDKLPASVSGTIDNALGGGANVAGDVADTAQNVLGNIGGMFGKKD